MINKIVALLVLVVAGSAFAADYAQFGISIYKDKTCSKAAYRDTLKVDSSKSCSNYSYVDSKGVTTKGSNGNFRCYKNKVVYDKYPFEENCNKKTKITEMAHAVPVLPGCLEAPSHEGPVWESITGYTYPGNENCQIVKKK